MDIITKLIKDTIKTGIGQSIIAFGAWFYVLVMLLVVIYYTIRCLIKLLSK